MKNVRGAIERERPVHIGGVIRDAVVFDPKNWGGEAVMESGELLQSVARFFDVLEAQQANFVLVGGIVMLQYVEGRNTNVLGVIAAASALEQMSDFDVVERDANFVRGTFEALRIDVLLPRNALFKKVQRGFSTTHEFLERDVPCATVEGLAVLKLYALPSLYRQGDFARVGLYENDVATLLFTMSRS